MKPAIACIYALTDPTNGRMYYVGQTVNFERRVAQHLRGSASSMVGTKVLAWIKRLHENGNSPQAIILEAHPRDELDQAEQRWVDHCRSQNEPLLNAASPGRYKRPRVNSPSKMPRSVDQRRVAIRDLQKDVKWWLRAAQIAPIVITRHGMPAAVCIGIEGYDWEDVLWMTDAAFWRMIHESRQQPTISREELDAELQEPRQRHIKK